MQRKEKKKTYLKREKRLKKTKAERRRERRNTKILIEKEIEENNLDCQIEIDLFYARFYPASFDEEFEFFT